MSRTAIRNSPPPLEIVVITGLSGSGKTLALRAFEDLGYFCVDNLPVSLIPVFTDLCIKSRKDINRAALVVDVREGKYLLDFPRMYGKLRRKGGPLVRLLYFESDDATLMQRFSETRRPHPLAGGGSLESGIRKEREALLPLRDLAEVMIDSSRFNVHQLRRYILEHFAPRGKDSRLAITVVSFGYKNGLPSGADLVFDARFLPNPFFIDGLRTRSGLEKEVVDFLRSSAEFETFRHKLIDLLDFLIPQYISEGKSYLTVAVGCTGGRHRSVASAEVVSTALRERGYAVNVSHRDIDRE